MLKANFNIVRHWDIYKITNPKGRIYIGLTSNLKKRIRFYEKGFSKDQRLLHRSIIKYGFKSHSFEVIDSFKSDIHYANGKEIFWIRTMMSFRKQWPEQNGMNLTKGGRGTLGVKKSEDFRKKARERNIGKTIPAEVKLKISQSMKGKQNSLGVRQSQYTKEKRASKLRGRKMTEEMRLQYKKQNTKLRGKAITQYDLNNNKIRDYVCINEASEQLSINRNLISFVVNGRQKSTKGYIFKYLQ